jgi:hypothetical protein
MRCVDASLRMNQRRNECGQPNRAWGLAPLTASDAAAAPMTDFFTAG